MSFSKKHILFSCIVLLIGIFVCFYLFRSKKRHTITRSFYYWKSEFVLSSSEQNMLQNLGIKKLYIKFFDVDIDKATQKALPLAKIQFTQTVNPSYEVVPTIYITNKTLLQTPVDEIAELSKNIAHLIKSIGTNNKLTYKEIQFDCDWTDKTRLKYFNLLQDIRNYFPKASYLLSATIRLHQIKYFSKTGVPPIDRGMLMFYNMGKLTTQASDNSIFNEKDALKYSNWIDLYPLQLDVALPIFSWGIHSRNKHIVNLLNAVTISEIEQKQQFKKCGNNCYIADSGFFYRGDYFMQNDILKIEEITPDICKQASELVADELPSTNRSVILYYIDSTNISRYEKTDFETIFTRFK